MLNKPPLRLVTRQRHPAKGSVTNANDYQLSPTPLFFPLYSGFYPDHTDAEQRAAASGHDSFNLHRPGIDHHS